MHPVVNTVDDSQSRIRRLEEQVQRLRLELDQKEKAPAATSVEDEHRTLDMQERLEAQLAQNQELIKHRETLARYCTLHSVCLPSVSYQLKPPSQISSTFHLKYRYVVHQAIKMDPLHAKEVGHDLMLSFMV
jgi:hypothetical protein